MKYTKLGNSDLSVSRICMGCMGFGDAQNGQHSWTLGEEQLIMLYKLCDLQSASSADEARTAYKAVFKDVVTMVAEIQE